MEEEKVCQNYHRGPEISPGRQPRSCCFECAFQYWTENWHWCKHLHLFHCMICSSSSVTVLKKSFVVVTGRDGWMWRVSFLKERNLIILWLNWRVTRYISLLDSDHISLNKLIHVTHSFCLISMCRRLLSMQVMGVYGMPSTSRGIQIYNSCPKKQQIRLMGRIGGGLSSLKVMFWKSSNILEIHGGLRKNIDSPKGGENTCMVA